ncbi:MAG TPA: hypothetical protein VEL76_10285 [Gemmataceae bacterium]|nr:hypothetical protein [Gemmataceae bacterium]
MLHSQEPKGKDAHGSTNASGAFELTALPGLYKVTVQYSEPIELSSKLKTPDEVKKALLEAYASRKPSVVIPTIYTQVAKTPLQHRVPEDGDLKVDLPRAPP